MRCQLHLEVEAASICVGCGRALCRDCQQTTRDERMICGLPQCEELVKRQKAVQFAIRQSCANNAETRLLLGHAMRHLMWILLVPSLALIVVILVVAALNRLAFTGDEAALFVMAVMFILLAWVVQRIQKGMLAQARNWEDISREFD